MAALGRVLGILGWLWFIAGFVAPALGIADIEFFPGLILVFLGRLLRGWAKRQQSEETPHAEATPTPQRPLNTERATPEPVPESPAPTVRTPPILAIPPSPAPAPPETRRPAPTPTPTVPADDAEEGPVSGKLLETIRRNTEETVVEDNVTDEGTRPLSSAEMIARAKQRWDPR